MVRCLWLIALFSFFMAEKAHAIVHTNKPYSYEVLQNDLTTLKSAYNDSIQIKIIGRSHFGRDIYAIHLGTGKKNILLIGSHHGREWLTSMLLMKMLETYANAYQNQLPIGTNPTNILNDVSIWFVPMVNPDGVDIQQNHIGEFPPEHQTRLLFMNKGKNDFIRWKANGMGVDLNRQYPMDWRSIARKPKGPAYQFYKGKAPLEAAEVVVLTNFIQDIQPSMALTYHTAGREIYWRYKNGMHLVRDYILAKKVAKLTGYKLAKPPKKAVGGGFTDWFIPTYHRPAMTIEISYLVGDRHPPLSVFKEEWKRNKYVGIKMAEEAKKFVRKD
jgi:g-D-glutamyl-meso-diaminopimelate peptidase